MHMYVLLVYHIYIYSSCSLETENQSSHFFNSFNTFQRRFPTRATGEREGHLEGRSTNTWWRGPSGAPPALRAPARMGWDPWPFDVSSIGTDTV